jgi:hypothetical protein
MLPHRRYESGAMPVLKVVNKPLPLTSVIGGSHRRDVSELSSARGEGWVGIPIRRVWGHHWPPSSQEIKFLVIPSTSDANSGPGKGT